MNCQLLCRVDNGTLGTARGRLAFHKQEGLIQISNFLESNRMTWEIKIQSSRLVNDKQRQVNVTC